MSNAADSLPKDVATLQAMLLTERAARLAAESEAKLRALQIEQLKYTIAKLRHQKFGQSSERGAILEQLELQLSELQADASEAAAAAQLAAARAKIGNGGNSAFAECRPHKHLNSPTRFLGGALSPATARHVTTSFAVDRKP